MSELFIDKPEIYYDCISSEDMNQFLGGGESSVLTTDENKTKCTLKTQSKILSITSPKKHHLISDKPSIVSENNSKFFSSQFYKDYVGRFKNCKDKYVLLKQVGIIREIWKKEMDYISKTQKRLIDNNPFSPKIEKYKRKYDFGFKLYDKWWKELFDAIEKLDKEKSVAQSPDIPMSEPNFKNKVSISASMIENSNNRKNLSISKEQSTEELRTEGKSMNPKESSQKQPSFSKEKEDQKLKTSETPARILKNVETTPNIFKAMNSDSADYESLRGLTPTQIYQTLVGNYTTVEDPLVILNQIISHGNYFEQKLRSLDKIKQQLIRLDPTRPQIEEYELKIKECRRVYEKWSRDLMQVLLKISGKETSGSSINFSDPKLYQALSQIYKIEDRIFASNCSSTVYSIIDESIDFLKQSPGQSLESEAGDIKCIKEEVTHKKDLETKLSDNLQIQTNGRNINGLNRDQEVLSEDNGLSSVSLNKSVSGLTIVDTLNKCPDKPSVTNEQQLKDNSPDPRTEFSKLKPDYQQENISTLAVSEEKLKCGNELKANQTKGYISSEQQLYSRFVGQYKNSKNINLLYKRILKIEKLFSVKSSKFSNYLTIIRKLSMNDHLIKSIESQIKMYETLCEKWCCELKTSIHQNIIEELKEENSLFKEIEIDSERHLNSETTAESNEEIQAVSNKTSFNLLLKPNQVERKVNSCSPAINTEQKQNSSTNTIVKPQILSSMSEFHQKFLGNAKSSRNFEKNSLMTFEKSTQTDNGIYRMRSFKPKSKESTIICMNCDRKGHFFKNCFQPLNQQLIIERLKQRKVENRNKSLAKHKVSPGSTSEKSSDSQQIKENNIIANKYFTPSETKSEQLGYILKNSSKLQNYSNNKKSFEDFQVFPNYKYLYS